MNEATLLNINQLHSTGYHHESIGALENSHKALGAFLRIQHTSQEVAWSTWLPYWCFSYNTSVHSATNYSPFELVFGKQCHIPTNINSIVEPMYNFDNYPLELKYRLQKANEDARKKLIISKIRRKQTYDEKINPIQYKQGDLILLKNEDGNKFQVHVSWVPI